MEPHERAINHALFIAGKYSAGDYDTTPHIKTEALAAIEYGRKFASMYENKKALNILKIAMGESADIVPVIKLRTGPTVITGVEPIPSTYALDRKAPQRRKVNR